MSRILSIGYEKRSVDELVGILIAYDVMKLVDIRLTPISRRRGFSKNALSSSLDKAGIQYVHLRLAGNPYHQQTKDINRCLQLYTSYLEEHPEVPKLVANELKDSTSAVLCYERNHLDCHRSVLLNTISKNGHELDIIRVD